MAESTMFYCKICEAQMNSLPMWENHLKGRKHLKNEKAKIESEASTSTEQPAIARNTETTRSARIEAAIENVTEPVVGLDYICERQYSDTTIHPTYVCNLCNLTVGIVAIIDHITSSKHRLNYIKETDIEGYDIIEGMLDSKIPLDGLALERATTLEQKHGRGIVGVKLEESKYGAMRKRPGNLSKDDVPQKTPSVPSKSDDDDSTKTKEFLGRMPYFDIDTKIQIIEELSVLKVTNDDDARNAMNAITNLTQLLMQYKMRQLTPNQQNLPKQGEGGWMPMGSTDFPASNFGDEINPPRRDMFNVPIGYPQSRGNRRLPYYGGRGPAFM